MNSYSGFNKRVLITGAGGGLGRALALVFAQHDWKVALCDVDINGLDITASQLGGHGVDVLVQHCDVTSDQDMEQLRQRCCGDWGGVDVIINNAGVASMGAIHKEPLNRWQRLIDINLMGVVRGCKTFVPLLREQGGGHIVNIASIAGIANTPYMAAYNATKAAVISLSETLQPELKSSNIGITVVCPAMFKTGIAEGSGIDNPKLKSVLEEAMEKSPISADDIALQVYRAVEGNQFLLIPHRASRWQWRLKRLSPSLYRRMLFR
jgi:short-subunit dehydrogenase